MLSTNQLNHNFSLLQDDLSSGNKKTTLLKEHVHYDETDDYNANLRQALNKLTSTLSIIPLLADGSKSSAIKWAPYQHRRATELEMEGWFKNNNNYGYAIICGEVSGGLEVIDFDNPNYFDPWLTEVQTAQPALKDKLVTVKTPGGYHVYYCCSGNISGNQKLAAHIDDAGRTETDIETRGEGGYVVGPNNHSKVHSSGGSYELIQGTLDKIPTITPEERDLLISTARQFTRIAPTDFQIYKPKETATINGNRPGDQYNQKATWLEILEPHGWTIAKTTGNGVSYWRKPNKTTVGHSATTGYGDSDLLYVFSTNASPFEPCRAYDKFAAHALLNHGGDFKAAASDLAAKGYGKNTETDKGDYTSPNQWEEPVIFEEEECPEIKANLLPGWLGTYAKAVADYTQTPEGMSVMIGLSMVATCLQKKVMVRLTNNGDYREPVNLWTATVMEPGSRKSAVLQAFTEPLIRWETNQIELMQEKSKTSKTEISVAEKRIAKLEKQAANEEDISKRTHLKEQIVKERMNMPEPIVAPKMFVNDCTMERLQDLLCEQDGKMSWLSAEGGLFDLADGPYTNGRCNFDVLLQSHSGDPVRVERMGRTVTLNDPALTLGLAVQPRVITDLSNGSKNRFRGKGVNARFLYYWPKSNIGERDVWHEAVMPANVKQAYIDGISQLLSLSGNREFMLSPEALTEWRRFCQYVENGMKADGALENIRDWAGKLPGAALRIAGLMHMVSGGLSSEISAETMRQSLDLGELLIPHAKKVLDTLGTDPVVSDAKYTQEWLLSHVDKKDNVIAIRDLKHIRRFKASSEKRLAEVLSFLEARSIVSPEFKKNGTRRPTRIRYINPALLQIGT